MSEVVAEKRLSFSITTMGCKVNTYDTSLLEKQLLAGGFAPVETGGFKPVSASESSSGRVPGHRVHIINSCAVTEKSSLETHRHVKKIKAHDPEAVVVITGCVAQVDVDRLKSLTGADLIIGNSHKGDFHQIVRDYIEGRNTERVFHSNIFKKDALDEGGGIESSRTRAFLKVQDGCNSFCSFCIIPFARGKSRSLTKDHLVSRVRDLHHQGFQEVVLTGVHCGDYEDGDLNFADLVEAVLEETRVPRIRLSSLEPIEVTPKLWSLFKNNSKLCPHLHVSLQSANTRVLQEMRRKYGQNEIAEFFKTFSDVMPQSFIGMDVIVGFPGETEEEFMDTYNFLAAQPWTRIHVFPYSIRPGTTAAKKPGHLREAVIHERARRLRALSSERQKTMAERQRGCVKSVLVLEKATYGSQGLSRDYWPVQIADFDHEKHVNQEVQVEITGSLPLKNGEQVLTGRLLQ